MHALIDVNIDEVVELIGVARAKDEVGKGGGLLGPGIGSRESARVLGRCAKTEAAVVGVLTIDRVEVVDGGEDGLILVAHLVGASTVNTSVVNLGVEDVGVLELWIAALITELGESADALDVKASNNCRARGETRDAGHQAVQVRAERRLATVGASEGEAGIEDRVLIEDMSDAAGDLLIEDINRAVAVAARRSLDVRRRVDGSMMLAIANKGIGALAEGMVDADVELVVVKDVGRKGGVVIGEGTAGDVGSWKRRENTLGERGDRGVRERDNAGVELAGEGIKEWDGSALRGEEGIAGVGHGEGAGAVLVGRWNRGLHGGVLNLTGAFVVAEEEGVILPDGAAKGATELVADEDWLLRLAGQRVVGWREGADRVQNRITEVVISLAVKVIGTAADTDVDHGSGGAAVLGAVVVGFDAELIDSVGRRRDGLVGEALVGGAVGVVVDTVEQKVVEFTALTVDVEGGVAAGIRGVFDDVAADAGDESG